jgi:hypothetical protein
VGPPAEQAWNELAATCTPGTAAAYRGVVPDVRPDTGARPVITVHPAGAVPLTVAYEQSHRLLNAARVRPADEGTDQALRAMGCASKLIWTAIQPN